MSSNVFAGLEVSVALSRNLAVGKRDSGSSLQLSGGLKRATIAVVGLADAVRSAVEPPKATHCELAPQGRLTWAS